jgi:hypothetical protein
MCEGNAMPLPATGVKHAKARSKPYKLGDGGGLYTC